MDKTLKALLLVIIVGVRVIIINIGDATEKGCLFLIAGICHAVRLHARNENKVVWADQAGVDSLTGLGVMSGDV